jgi:uncharacterized damage-inducible protein DinB
LPQQAVEDIMPICEMLLPEFDQEMASTRKTLERVPDDKLDYRPHAKSMTFGRLAGHVAELPAWAMHTLALEGLDLDADYKPWIPKSRTEILSKFDESVAEARKLISGVKDEDLQKIWTLKLGGKTLFSMPRIQVLRSTCLNHMIHHRAQLGVYLRLNEIAVPGMYGPSADEMKSWGQTASS